MSIGQLKNKISKQLEEMDAEQLQHAYIVLQELSFQKKMKEREIDRNLLEKKLKRGIEQLDNGEGTDFKAFLNELEVRYGFKK